MKTKTLALAVLVSCGACVGAWVVPRPSSSSPPHAPAPGAKPTHVVSVRAKALRVEGERVIFAPEEEGERATRVRYIFARAELLKAAGALRDVVLRIEQVRSQTRWLVPPTPGAGPTSGVRAIEIECRIVGVE